MKKIVMKNPVVEMDGDEMTRVLWRQIKEILIEPFVELNTEYYDLGLKCRDATDDAVTHAAAEAIKEHKVGVKCATITPNAERVKEYGLKKMWKSPNGTIRAELDGTVFREPVTVEGIKPIIAGWKEPITIARHAYGDIYKASEFKIGEGESVVVTVGGESRAAADFKGGGVLSVMHNLDRSIEKFAENCFNYALEKKKDLWFGTKDTISKIYDGRFKDIFNRLYLEKYKERFGNAGIIYFYGLIDDVVARVMRSGGGFIWACKNYDGDVMSDMVSTVFGSLAMMTSVLVSEHGFEYEAAHGTVTRHYYKYLKGEKTSTNPVATVFAWTGALKKRGDLDGNAELSAFAANTERAVLETIEGGVMTNDLLPLFRKDGITPRGVGGEELLKAAADKLESFIRLV
ncbi:MAG: NADP-dependent isocitrate dehydrogenase [Clostridiales bacterium]|jgi:isocitrate dehydrogenase|nr:NADP-dependent isocitrate dehydrogenase [Clostridiales bacterium]